MATSCIDESLSCENLLPDIGTSDAISIRGKAQCIAECLAVTEKGKFKWNGTFEDLVKLMKELTNEDSWKSTGGDCKMLKANDVEVRWYSNSNSLTIKCKANEEMKTQLRVLINVAQHQGEETDENTKETDYNGRLNSDSLIEQSDFSNVEPLLAVIQKLEENFQRKFIDLRNEIQEIKQNQVQQTLQDDCMNTERTKTTTNNNDLFVGVADHMESIKVEKDRLQRENAALQGELNNYKMIASDLNAKIEELTGERNSLVTVIKILQEDEAPQTQRNWKVVQSKQNKEKENHDNKQNKQRAQSSGQLANRYSILSVSDNEETESLAAENGNEMESRTQQPKNTNNNKDKRSKNEHKNEQEERQHFPKGSTENHPSKSTPTKVAVAGDSMVKHLNGYKMSKGGKTKVHVSSFSGCTTRDMADHIKPILRKNPDKLILHVGTNNLKEQMSSTQCVEEIVNLAESIKSSNPNMELAISSLVMRLDDQTLTNKVNEVNVALKQSCMHKQLNFINNDNITSQNLNQSKIHLNRSGISMMARNYVKYIYSK